jgi:hypothetical protein
MHDEHPRCRGQRRDRREILERVVGNFFVENRIDRKARCADHEPITTGRLTRRDAHPEIAASIGVVLDVEVLPEIRRHPLRPEPRDDIRHAAGRNGTITLTGRLG